MERSDVRFLRVQCAQPWIRWLGTSDLLYYADQLILAHHPKKIFIYEGDNKISVAEAVWTPSFHNAALLVDKIRQKLPDAKDLFSHTEAVRLRWHLKKSYVEFNKSSSVLRNGRQR